MSRLLQATVHHPILVGIVVCLMCLAVICVWVGIELYVSDSS